MNFPLSFLFIYYPHILFTQLEDCENDLPDKKIGKRVLKIWGKRRQMSKSMSNLCKDKIEEEVTIITEAQIN